MQATSDVARSPAAPGSLVLYRQKSVTSCERPVKGLRILGADGRFFPVRCKRCEPCRRLADFELAQLLLIDARQVAPTHAITLTTRQPWETLDPAAYRLASAVLWKRLRRRYGQVEYAASVEFTTGLAATSGGKRRMHAHHLVKGLDGRDVLDVEQLVRGTWAACMDSPRVEVAELISAGAAIPYLGLHHRKAEQAPPKGWRGMRFRASAGYFTRPRPELREQARLEQRARRLRWKAERLVAEQDVPVSAALDWVADQLADVSPPGRLVRVRDVQGRLPEPTA